MQLKIKKLEDKFLEMEYGGYIPVDLDLPSGTLWASKNIGAEDEYDAGLYFQWGDTQGYTADQVGNNKVFNQDTYKFGKYNPSATNRGMNKYNGVDGETILENEDDTAFIATNGKFRMPTQTQIAELLDKTTRQLIRDNNGTYMKFTSKEDSSKFIVLPTTGYANNYVLSDTNNGFFWSSSLDPYSVRSGNVLHFNQNGYINEFSSDYRYQGCSVRGVLNK